MRNLIRAQNLALNEVRFKGMTVDDFLGGGFMGSDDDEDEVCSYCME